MHHGTSTPNLMTTAENTGPGIYKHKNNYLSPRNDVEIAGKMGKELKKDLSMLTNPTHTALIQRNTHVFDDNLTKSAASLERIKQYKEMYGQILKGHELRSS